MLISLTRLSVRFIEGVHLIGDPLNRGFTVLNSMTTCSFGVIHASFMHYHSSLISVSYVLNPTCRTSLISVLF